MLGRGGGRLTCHEGKTVPLKVARTGLLGSNVDFGWPTRKFRDGPQKHAEHMILLADACPQLRMSHRILVNYDSCHCSKSNPASRNTLSKSIPSNVHLHIF